VTFKAAGGRLYDELYIEDPAAPPPPSIEAPPPPPPRINTSALKGSPKIAVSKVELPTVVKVCVRYPPASTVVPPEIKNFDPRLNLLTGANVPLTLLINGIYFSFKSLD
jgi:hypothetical protein